MRMVKLEGGRRLTQDDLNRTGALPADVVASAERIVGDVRARGDAAVRELCLRFDGACPEDFRVPDELVRSAPGLVPEEFLAALSRARDQIRDFHEREREQSWFTTRADGTMLGVKVTPVASAAVYVPGGRAQYPSTVLMDTIPAKVAGVGRVVMVTPPQADGTLSAYTLAAAALAGVDEVYAVGGAQAIKRLVSGDVGIDMVAGPSEVCVLADASADPVVVAADLMAQAEHDPMASCYLVTCDEGLPERVLEAVETLVAQSPREGITRTSLDERGVIVVCEATDAAVDAVNVIAPEHLELHCEDAMALLGRVRNAGAIFVGPWSSEPLGDYVAGPNHTLPTGGTARWANPLGVYDFQKRSSVICYTPEGLLADAPATQTIAQAEGLWAHALSVGLRRRIAEGGAFDASDVHRVAWPETLRGDGPFVSLEG